jgi:hypothetical protein
MPERLKSKKKMHKKVRTSSLEYPQLNKLEMDKNIKEEIKVLKTIEKSHNFIMDHFKKMRV